ncbi:LCP family protein [Selenomonas sp.]|uniref:LCP family protein n=1 Tax=Selenomonas sp. TaxID=2053611 RepID=UPI003FA1A94C
MILQNHSTPPAAPKKKRRILPYVAIVFVFFAAAAAGALFASTSLLDKDSPKADEEHLLTAKDKATIMIMGVDQREDDVGRSDTLMVTMIDPKKNQAALLSVPRDTRVKIKGHGYDKINAAYAYGGHKLSESTVEDLLGVRIDHYIIINTHSFQRIIDALGGIDINVEKRMYYEDPWDDDGGLLIDLKPGMQHMNGKTAVTYVRYRDEEGDIGRIERQQKFMKAVMEKVTSPAIVTRLPAVIKEVMGSIETDLSFRQLLEFAGTLKDAQKNGLKTDMVPGRPLYISEISYWIPDIVKLRQTVASTLGIDVNASMRAAMERESSEYENSIPAGATEVPADDHSIGRIKERTSAGKAESSAKEQRRTDASDKDDKSTGSKERTTAPPERRNTTVDTDAPRTRTDAADTAPSADSAAPVPGGTIPQKTQ